MEINDIIDRLFDYFEVTSIQDLAKKMNVSQQQLASKLGISPRTLESWERGVRHPSSSAQALIKLFIKSPQFVLENLA